MNENKKRILIFGGIIGFVLLLVIGFRLFYSELLVEKRFLNALEDAKTNKLARITYHENASSITKGEAEALIKLHDEEAIDDKLYEVKAKPILFGLLKKNQVQMKSFYAAYDDWFEGLTLTFNQEEIPIHDKVEHHLEYGPLIPGIYDVKADFQGVEKVGGGEETIKLQEKPVTNITIPLDVSTVVFSVENAESIGRETIRIHWNDESYKITESGKTNRIGPIALDGTEEATVVVEFPWGEVTSEPLAITSSEMELPVEPITKENQKKIDEQIISFADTYVESIVKGTVNSLLTGDEEVISTVQAHISDGSAMYADSPLKAGLDHVKVTPNKDETDWQNKDPLLVYDVMFTINDLTAYEASSEQADQLDEQYLFAIGLKYSKEADDWEVVSLDPLETWAKNVDDITRLEGSKTAYMLNRDGIKTKQTTTPIQSEVEQEIEQLVEDYTTALTKSWNKNDITHVETFLTADSLRYAKSVEEIKSMNKKDKWELKRIDFEKILKISDTIYDVTTKESFEVKKGNEKINKRFQIVTRVKRVGERSFKIYDEVSKEEIK